jgi:hypothetical protein
MIAMVMIAMMIAMVAAMGPAILIVVGAEDV